MSQLTLVGINNVSIDEHKVGDKNSQHIDSTCARASNISLGHHLAYIGLHWVPYYLVLALLLLLPNAGSKVNVSVSAGECAMNQKHLCRLLRCKWDCKGHWCQRLLPGFHRFQRCRSCCGCRSCQCCRYPSCQSCCTCQCCRCRSWQGDLMTEN